jgi:uncharacterized membrane protein YozB (DUF420 family)
MAGPPAWLAWLPTLNAVLNATSAALVLAGWGFIRRRRIAAHRACMAGAVVASALFLVSYLAYHARIGSMPYRGTGPLRVAYFAILISHTLLAAVIVPLVAVTLTRALRERFEAHRRIARVTLPIWLYVSVTGVVIYLMLYVFGPAPAAAPSP